jgi:hypothetical protein
MMRGVRVDVTVPNSALVRLPARSNRAVVLRPEYCVWLKALSASQLRRDHSQHHGGRDQEGPAYLLPRHRLPGEMPGAVHERGSAGKEVHGVAQGDRLQRRDLGAGGQALRESHRDERQFHDDAITELQHEHRRLQGRIDSVYEDKLDGRLGNDFFDAKTTEMRAEQARIMRDLGAHQKANRSYIEEGVQLLELAHRAPVLFESQPAAEKRRLLDFVLSNCTWKGGELAAKYRQPFDVLAVAVASEQQRIGGEMAEMAKNEIWLPR